MLVTRRRGGLASRFFGAQLVTIAVAVVTLGIVAAIIGPPILNAHLHEALGPLPGDAADHLQQGYNRAVAITVAVAALAGVGVAVVVSLVVTRRVTHPIVAVSAAAASVAAGQHGTRVPASGLGAEIDCLVAAFNSMAATLDETEQSRQQLLSDLAHELRTPLATIRACHEALADGVRRPDGETWALLEAQTQRLQRLVDDIATVSRVEEGALSLTLKPTPIRELLDHAAAAARPGYQAKGVSLQLAASHADRAVQVDSDRLGQVIAILLDNALRHTQSGDEVRLTAVTSEQRGAAAGPLAITVSDNGDGIAPGDLSHVFTRFFRTDAARDRDHGGSGIGLTIARALVHAHHGTLTAASDGLGKGSTFTIELPAFTDSVTDSPADSSVDSPRG